MKLPVPSVADMNRIFDDKPAPTAEQLRGDERAANVIAKHADDPHDINQAIRVMTERGIRPDQTSGDIGRIMQRAAALKAKAAKATAVACLAAVTLTIAALIDAPLAADLDVEKFNGHLRRGFVVLLGLCVGGIALILIGSWWASRRRMDVDPIEAQFTDDRRQHVEDVVRDAQRGL